MNINADDKNEKYTERGRISKVWKFSKTKYWKNIGCIFLEPIFGVGGYILWEKDEGEKISGNKRNRNSIRGEFYLYEVFAYIYIFALIYFIMNILKFNFPSPYLWHILNRKMLLVGGFKEVCIKTATSYLTVGDESMSAIFFK